LRRGHAGNSGDSGNYGQFQLQLHSQQRHRAAGRALGGADFQAVPAMSRWAQGILAVKLLQELGRGDGAAGAAGHVAHVGEVALQAFAVFVVQRHAPARVQRLLARGQQRGGQGVVVREQAAAWWPSAITQAPVRVAMSTTAAA
jgi:hypothetical protein